MKKGLKTLFRSAPFESILDEWSEITEMQEKLLAKMVLIDENFTADENCRSEGIKSVLESAHKKLLENAYKQSHECTQIIHYELLGMNQSLIRNHRRVLELKQMFVDKIILEGFTVEKEFVEHKAKWKELQVQKFIRAFRDFIDSPDAKHPPQAAFRKNTRVRL